MTELERLKDRLFNQPDGRTVTNFNVWPGDKPGLTAEEVAGQVNRVLDAMEAGELESSESFHEDLEPVEVKDWLKKQGVA